MLEAEVNKFTREDGVVTCTVKIGGLVGYCTEPDLPVFIERLRKVAEERNK